MRRQTANSLGIIVPQRAQPHAAHHDELDGPEHGEDENSDPAEPALGSLDGRTDQTGWAAGDRRDLE